MDVGLVRPRAGSTGHPAGYAPSTANVMTAFAAWAEQQGPAHPAGPTSALLQEGLALATARRALLKELMQRDPEAAWRARIPPDQRRRLPATIQALLEEPINTAGTYRVAIACDFGAEPHAHHEDHLERLARIGNRSLQVFTFGSRKEVASKDRMSLVGFALDGVMVLADSPVRELPPPEAAALGYPGGLLVAEGMGEIRVFTDPAELEEWRAALTRDEWAVGPGSSGEPQTTAGPAPASAYTEGRKTLLYITCDFPNLTGFPVTTAAVSNAMQAVTSFYFEASFGKVQLVPTYVPGVLRLPRNGENYTNAFSTLLSDAETVARAAGYDVDDYDHYVVLTDENSSGINFSYAGKAWIGSPGCHLVEPNYTLRTAGHELGHNFGLRHANYWRTDADQPSGRDSMPGGYVGDTVNAEWIEYGHQFTLMSGQGTSYMTPAAHFTPAEKKHLNWLTTADLAVVTNSQTIRLYRFDHRLGAGSPRAIRIARPGTDYTGNQREYWLGYRAAFPTNGWLMNGLQVDWMKSYYGSDGSIQLDLTPYSNDDNTGASYTDDLNDKNDGTLLLGRTASDPGADIHVTPVDRGGTAPDEWIEVVIHLDTLAGNRAPAVTLAASATNGATGAALVFTAAGTDPDGDDLSYAWDFGWPRLIFSNSLNRAVVTNSWSAAGEYVVRCVASDRKGGRASTSLVVRIGNPSTYRITGRVMAGDQGVENVRVYTAHTNMTYTDSAGYYQLVNLRAASFTVGARLLGQAFTPAFDNPVTVGPSTGHRDFGWADTPALLAEGSDDPVPESGPAGTYRIRLASRPATNVQVAITWSTSQVAVGQAAVVLNPNQWLTGCVVGIHAVDDLRVEESTHTTEVFHTSASADPAYDGLAALPLLIRILDNDTNQLPLVTLDAPQPGSRWPQYTALPAALWAEDPDGVITQAMLLADGTPIAQWSQPPFTTSITNLAIGPHLLTAQVWDTLGEQATSDGVAIEILCDLDRDGVPDCDDEDDDGDGLSDAFESRYFGGLTNAQPHLDQDLDGFCNLSEQIAATDPTNNLSFFHLLTCQPGQGGTLVVPSVAGRLYTLQASGGIHDGNTWSNVTGQVDLPGTGSDLILMDPSPEPVRVYRLWVTEP